MNTIRDIANQQLPPVLDKLNLLIKQVEVCEVGSLAGEGIAVMLITRLHFALELSENLKGYKALNFYRNWLLHARLTKPIDPEIFAVLKLFIEHPEERDILLSHNILIEELHKGLHTLGLSTMGEPALEKLLHFLGNAVADSAVHIKVGEYDRIVRLGRSSVSTVAGVYVIHFADFSSELKLSDNLEIKKT